MGVVVCTEQGARRVFASALDWPGWCRSGRDETEALGNLAAYSGRYAKVTALAGIAFSAGTGAGFEIVERLTGNATTDFGAPAIAARYEDERLGAAGATQMAALVGASWLAFDDAVAKAPAELRKGPRGGGRDRDQIVAHLAEAEVAYARKLGVRLGRDQALRREAIIAVLGTPGRRAASEKEWPPRYAARRIAWHVLDHAWEIEDKS